MEISKEVKNVNKWICFSILWFLFNMQLKFRNHKAETTEKLMYI